MYIRTDMDIYDNLFKYDFFTRFLTLSFQLGLQNDSSQEIVFLKANGFAE